MIATHAFVWNEQGVCINPERVLVYHAEINRLYILVAQAPDKTWRSSHDAWFRKNWYGTTYLPMLRCKPFATRDEAITDIAEQWKNRGELTPPMRSALLSLLPGNRELGGLFA